MSLFNVVGLLIVAWALWSMRPRTRGKLRDVLDAVLFTWAGTPFNLRSLCQSVLILGAAGAGKTSGSGRHFQRILISIPNSGGLIIASKPEDREDWIRAFKAAGREGDLTIMGPNEEVRCNFFGAIGGDASNLTNGIEVMAELVGKQKDNSQESFWPRKRKEAFYNAIVMLRLAGEEVSAFNILRFIRGAATTVEMLQDKAYLGGYTQSILHRAYGGAKGHRDVYDYQAAFEMWTKTWPQSADKTRANIEAEVSGVCHPMVSGVVRDLIGTTTNFKPEELGKGKWLLVDMPLQVYGESGRFVGAAMKLLVQKSILARHAKGDDGPICIWIDECHNYITSYDAVTLAEQRSHRGVAAYLTQSIHSFTSNIGEAFTDALLTNFGTKIFHQVGDAKTADYGSSLLGQVLEDFVGGGPEMPQSPLGTMTFKPSFNSQFTPVLQPREFMTGLRTSGGVVDAIVIRSEPFADGNRHALISFQQG